MCLSSVLQTCGTVHQFEVSSVQASFVLQNCSFEPVVVFTCVSGCFCKGRMLIVQLLQHPEACCDAETPDAL